MQTLAKINDDSLKEKLQNLDEKLKEHINSIKSLEYKEYPNDEKIKSLKKNTQKKQKDFISTVEKNSKISQEQKIENMLNFIKDYKLAHGKNLGELNSENEKYKAIGAEVQSVKNMIEKEQSSFGIMDGLLKKASARKEATFSDWKGQTEEEKSKTENMNSALEEELK